MADDYFLKIDGIEGESTDARHKGEIALDAWSFGGTAGSVEGKPSGPTRPGIASGRFNAQDFQFTAKASKASPKLFEACATGMRLRDVTLFARKAGDEKQEYLRIRLTDVVISSYQQGGSSGVSDAPVEQVACNFARIEIEYKEQSPDGSLGGSVTAMVDVRRIKSTRAKSR
ncbi:MAG: type VI secretion system tube protein Hcp [Nitrospira sp.]|jgi:type VI secretion system secreted protein Hcp